MIVVKHTKPKGRSGLYRMIVGFTTLYANNDSCEFKSRAWLASWLCRQNVIFICVGNASLIQIMKFASESALMP